MKTRSGLATIRPIPDLASRSLGAWALLVAVACSGCEARNDGPRDSVATQGAVLAVVDGRAISADEVDEPLRLELYDLEWAAYERRLERLHALASNALGNAVEPDSPEWKERVEIRLDPPDAPRLAMPDDLDPIRGEPAAPVTLVEFMDYESPHCRRLQPELARVLDRYPRHVRLVLRDLPLPYHRYAWPAATATHCAAEQGAGWAYHELLLVEQDERAAPDFAGLAAPLGLDVARLEACLASKRYDPRIRGDLDLAAALGVRRAPTLFVNGIYLSGLPTAESIERVVRDELERLGAGVEPAADFEAHGKAPADPAHVDPTLPGIVPDEMPEPDFVVTLDRDELERALEDRRSLDRKLEASRREFSGRRLLKLRRIDEDDLYSRLGLEEGDVLLLVDGQFVTAEHNPLWEILARRDSVTLLVMRRGLPRTTRYRIR